MVAMFLVSTRGHGVVPVVVLAMPSQCYHGGGGSVGNLNAIAVAVVMVVL